MRGQNTAPYILNLRTAWICVVSFMLWLFYPPGEGLHYSFIREELGIWQGAKSLPQLGIEPRLPCEINISHNTHIAMWLCVIALIVMLMEMSLHLLSADMHCYVQNISDESDEEKSKNIYQIQTLYAFDLFNNKQFHESMKEFLNLRTGETSTSWNNSA
jgi:hypothetical protein